MAAIRDARGMLAKWKDSFVKEWAEHTEAEIGIEEDKIQEVYELKLIYQRFWFGDIREILTTGQPLFPAS